MGIITAIGQGCANFRTALLAGQTAFGYLQREGRVGNKQFLGAEIGALDKPTAQHQRFLRRASLTTQLALPCALEAWEDAGLDGVDPTRIGIVMGGSNVQMRGQSQTWARYAKNPQFITPGYSLMLWDTDIMGILSEALGIRGEGFSVGSASASGGMALVHGARQIMSGRTDVCLVVGSLFDLSSHECHAFKNMGAMGSERFKDDPDAACRPFDRDSDGFIYGEGCGVMVLESAEHAKARNAPLKAHLLGWASNLDGNRQANPSMEGERDVMTAAMEMGGISAEKVTYVNTHGTSSRLGDKTEVAAIRAAGLEHAYLNATKSLTGHCLTAAGMVEAIATVLQMQMGQLHPTNNLENPIDPDLCWAQLGDTAEIPYALSNSFGFGGINTSILLGKQG